MFNVVCPPTAGPGGRVAIDVLQDDVEARRHVAQILNRVCAGAPDARAAVAQLKLCDGASLGPYAGTLFQLVSHKNSNVATACFEVLKKVEPPALEIHVKMLLGYFNHTEWRVRQRAAQLLALV